MNEIYAGLLQVSSFNFIPIKNKTKDEKKEEKVEPIDEVELSKEDKL